ncbi:hypothetical protein [Aeromonas veronii]|uniref:hypothetical protein n=1 Tax=Aeromonas veronii TaxID=654 RepID=UPI001455FD5D|nr:hypothetical protein [Aeromonas veronii]
MQQKVTNTELPIPPKLLSAGDAYGTLVDTADRLRLYISTATLPNGLPKFDILAKIANRVPFIVYDNPEFTKRIGCNTAFTEGNYVFFHADFISKCLRDDAIARRENSGVTSSVFLGLHELSHIAYGHTAGRMRECPKSVLAIATDQKINLTLKYRYSIEPGETLMRGCGLTDEEKRLWLGCSEELIAYQLLALQKKWREEQKQNSQPQAGDQGGQPQAGDQGGQPQAGNQGGQPQAGNQGGQPQAGNQGGQPQAGNQGGQPQAGNQGGQPQAGNQGGQGGLPELSQELENSLKQSLLAPEEHVIDMKAVIKALEDAGLHHVKDALKLPDSDDDARIKMAEDKAIAQLGEDLQALNKQRQELASNGGASGPSEGYAKEYLQMRNRSQKTYKSALRELYLGDGSVDVMSCDDVPAPIYYVDPTSIGFAEPLYLDSLIPAKKEHGVLINIVDSSGSMGKFEIGQALSELHQQLQQAEDENGVSKVYFWSADTELRGDPIEVTQDNVEKLCNEMPIFGRGGTDITVPIKQAIAWSHEHEVRIDGILYISDLDVAPPKRSQLPESLPPIVILGAGTNANFLQQQLSKWQAGCKGFAEVSLACEEQEIDFAKLSEELGCDDYSAKTEGYGNYTPRHP